MKNRKFHVSFFVYLFLIIFSVVSIYPIAWMFLASTKSTASIFSTNQIFTIGNQFLTNIQNLLEKTAIVSALGNSLFIAIVSTVLTVYFSSLAGYAFAKFDFKFKNFLLIVIIALMTLPSQVTLIPLFKLINTMGLEDNSWAIILPSLASAMGVFLMRQNMESIPDEMIESAKMDGASEFRIFNSIVLPVSKPAIASLSVITFIGQWGNYLWPLIILKEEKSMTLPVILSNMQMTAQSTDYGMLLTGTLVSAVPIIIMFLFLQKYIIAGIYNGSVKG